MLWNHGSKVLHLDRVTIYCNEIAIQYSIQDRGEAVFEKWAFLACEYYFSLNSSYEIRDHLIFFLFIVQFNETPWTRKFWMPSDFVWFWRFVGRVFLSTSLQKKRVFSGIAPYFRCDVKVSIQVYTHTQTYVRLHISLQTHM